MEHYHNCVALVARAGDRMSVTRISNRKLDPVSEWLVKNGFPLTLRNWLDIVYWRDVKLSERSAETLEIPQHLLPKKYRCDCAGLS